MEIHKGRFATTKRIRRLQTCLDCSMISYRFCIICSIIFGPFWNYFAIFVRHRFGHRCWHRFKPIWDPKWFPQSALSAPSSTHKSICRLSAVVWEAFYRFVDVHSSTSIFGSIPNKLYLAPLWINVASFLLCLQHVGVGSSSSNFALHLDHFLIIVWILQ